MRRIYPVLSILIILTLLAFYWMPKIHVPSEWRMDRLMHLYYFACYICLTFLLSYLIAWAFSNKVYSVLFPALVVFSGSFIFVLFNREPILIALQVVIFFAALWKPFSSRAISIAQALWRNNKVFIILIMGFTLVTRLAFAYALTKANLDPFVLCGPDSAQYDLLAAHMFKETPIDKQDFGRFVQYDSGDVKWTPDTSPHKSYYDPVPPGAEHAVYISDYHKPLYAVFMGLIYRAWGHHRSLVRIAQAIMATLSVLLTYLIARKLFSPNVGKIAAFLDAGLGWFLCQSIYIAPEILALLLLQVSIYSILFLARPLTIKKSLLYSAVSGVSFGGVVLTRPEMFVFLPFLFIFLLVTRESRKKIFLCSVSLALFFIIAITPWVIRNYKVFGRVFLTPALNLSIGYTERHGYFEELSQIGVTFKDIRKDLPLLIKNAPFVSALIFDKARHAFPRYWSWRSPLNVCDFISFANDTVFRFMQHVLLYIALIAGLALGYKANSLSLLYYFLLAFFLLTFCLVKYNCWHAFLFIPVIHTFEALGLVRAVPYFADNMKNKKRAIP